MLRPIPQLRILARARAGGPYPVGVEFRKLRKSRSAWLFVGRLSRPVIAQQRPGLVRKIILAGTCPSSGESIGDVAAVLQDAFGVSRDTGALDPGPKII